MAKNIVIFSDGTGQAGGFRFDEKRSNIYKLYRATRCGPDSCIDPSKQIAFYDPGLGSEADGGHLWGGFARRVYNLISKATGFGITANIVDCYAALIRLYRPGDRIFLFGFSRGAYTVRCLAGVIAQCGIPTRLKDGKPLKLDLASSLKLARTAVKHVYQFTASRKYDDAPPRQKFLLDTRDRLAKRFREEHGSAAGEDANVYPYFIGVFDTVASLGSPRARVNLTGLFLITATAVACLLTAMLWALNVIGHFWLPTLFVTGIITTGAGIVAGIFYVCSHLKWDFRVPSYSWWQSLRTLHFTEPKQRFHDWRLNEHVRYAKHALAIDECRKDFKREPWGQRVSKRPARDENGHVWFEQVWFAGNHSDIGGSYPENESRLSDIALQWMVDCATAIPNGIIYDPSVLRLFGSPQGTQHDEVKVGFGLMTKLFGSNWEVEPRKPIEGATMHPSVYERFDCERIQQYDTLGPYRPEALRMHRDFGRYYESDSVFPADSKKSPEALAADPKKPFLPDADQNSRPGRKRGKTLNA